MKGFITSCLLAFLFLPTCKNQPPKKVQNFISTIERGNKFADVFNRDMKALYPEEPPDVIQLGFQELRLVLKVKHQEHISAAKKKIVELLNKQERTHATVAFSTHWIERNGEILKTDVSVMSKTVIIFADGTEKMTSSDDIFSSSDTTTKALETLTGNPPFEASSHRPSSKSKSPIKTPKEEQ